MIHPIQFAQGDPGALMFLMKVTEYPKIESLLQERLANMPSLRGTNLYILYSDLCNKDMEMVQKLLTNCPEHILEDACSRQDYSGRELVKDYLK